MKLPEILQNASQVGICAAVNAKLNPNSIAEFCPRYSRCQLFTNDKEFPAHLGAGAKRKIH